MSRQKAIAIILTQLEKVTQEGPKGPNITFYRDYFAKLDDVQFKQFIQDLKTGKTSLSIVVPNMDQTTDLDIERNFKLAQELGISFFERVWFGATADKPAHLSNSRYIILDLPVRAQAQLLAKKIRIPKDDKTIDDFTGQVTGASRGSSISFPQVRVMMALNLKETLTEFVKYRGGDLDGYSAMLASLEQQGRVSLNAVKNYGTGAESTRLLKTYLIGMHLGNTLPTQGG